MAKTDRIIYQSESLFVSNHKPASGTEIKGADIKEINRVQDMSYNLEVSRTDINEFGQLAALSREVTEPPTVSLDFSYYLTDGTQESKLGFNLNQFSELPLKNATSFTSDLLGGTGDEKNFYIVTTEEGADLHSEEGVSLNSSKNGVIAIGNAFVTSYGINAAVGELATASVSVEASNIVFKNDLSSSGTNRLQNPSVDVESSTGDRLTHYIDFSETESTDGNITSNYGGNEFFALRPGDISIDFDAVGWLDGTKSVGDLNIGGARLPGAGSELGTNNTSVHIQSVSIDLPIGRSPLNRLGNHFAFARKVDFPVNITLNASALMTDFTDGSLDGLMCDGEEKRDIAIIMRSQCGDNTPLVFVMRNAILDTQAFSASIGDNKTVDLTFSSQIGGSNDSNNGIFVLSEPGNPGVDAYVTTPTPEAYATPTPDPTPTPITLTPA